MFRRHLIALVVAAVAMLPLSVTADARVTGASTLIDRMIADLEAFLATDTGDTDARAAEIDRVLSTYGTLFRDVLCGTIVRNFDQLNRLVYTPGEATAKGDKFVIVSGTFTDTTGQRPAVAVSWRVLTREGTAPKLFDIEIENLSLLVTQKQENVAVIRKNKGDFGALIDAMRARLEAPVHTGS